MAHGESQLDAGTSTLPKETPPPVPDWNKSTTSTSDAASSAPGDNGKSSSSSTTKLSESSEGSLDFAPKGDSTLDLLTVGKDNSETLAFFKQSKAASTNSEVNGYGKEGKLPEISFGEEESEGIAQNTEELAPAQKAADDGKVKPTAENNFVFEQLNQHGIRPATPGITIGVMDHFQDGTAQDPAHGELVQSFINGDNGLLSSSAQVQQIDLAEPVNFNPLSYIARPDGLNSYIEDSALNSMNFMTNTLQNTLDNADPSLQVLNLSFAQSNSTVSQQIMQQLTSNPGQYEDWLNELVGEDTAQQIINHDVNFAPTEAHNQLMQAIADRVHDTLANSQQLEKLKQKYGDTTQQAAQSGVALVVAVGNHQDDLDSLGTEMKPGDGFNWYAQSEHVIAVGGSDIHGTPGVRQDDSITPFSSHGDAQHHPTVLAQANNLPAYHTADGISGTSFAAPQVAATVAVMMAQNPRMSFEDIKQTLIANSQKLDNVPVEAQGAGVLKMDEAILAARKKADGEKEEPTETSDDQKKPDAKTDNVPDQKSKEEPGKNPKDGKPDEAPEKNPEEPEEDPDAPEEDPDAPVEAPLPPTPSGGWYGGPSSEIPYIHEQIHQHGIEPQAPGITVGVIETSFGSDGENTHGTNVQSFINGEHGLIPGAQVQQIIRDDKDHDRETDDYADKTDGLDHYIEDYATHAINSTSDLLQQTIQNADPSMHVINMSFGVNNTALANNIVQDIAKDPEKHREWLNQMLGPEKAQQFIDQKDKTRMPTELDKELMQKVQDRVDDVIANSCEVNEAKQRWQDVTHQAADNGIAIVVAVGNQQDDVHDWGIQTQPGDTYNWYAQSDHVIAVGATDTQETPGKREDDKLTDFSSHGDSHFHPTVVTQGNHLPAPHGDSDIGIAGTSFAAPQVAATVAMMMAQNPKMTFQEIKQTLEQNATKIPKVGVEAQGAGILRPEDAIIAAHNSGDNND